MTLFRTLIPGDDGGAVVGEMKGEILGVITQGGSVVLRTGLRVLAILLADGLVRRAIIYFL